MLNFDERIALRIKTWWNPKHRLSPRGIHLLLDRMVLRTSKKPIEKWHCCSMWQRSLLNKWNSREFAKLLGVQVPELYWIGRNAAKLPIDQLPENFAIRPVWGAGSKGTYVISGTKNLLNNECYSDRSALKQAVLREHGRWRLYPLLAEEFMLNRKGEPKSGIEYKFLMFGHHIAAIMTYRRVEDKKVVRFYNDQWEPFAHPFFFEVGQDEIISCPDNFEEMKNVAITLGTAFGTFVRVDLYNTPKGVYFGEFSSVPRGGVPHTDFANEYLGNAWQTYMPHQI